MELSISIKYETQIDELTQDYPGLSFLKKIKLNEDNSIAWQRTVGLSYDIQVIFIGKTGYGKSSTLNAIVGKQIFETSDIKSCTKQLHSAEYRLHNTKPYYFSLCDLPGVGESIEADKQYLDWYRGILQKSNCVVYVLRADQRDFSVDEQIFKELFNTPYARGKVVLALNYADKVEPINRAYPFSPSELQIKNLKEKVNSISKLFEVAKENIIYYSAAEKYNVDGMVNRIAQVIKRSYI